MGGPGFSFVPTTSTSGGGTTYTGTANQVVVTGTVLSTPQDIATTSTPQFGGLGIGVAAAAGQILTGNGTKDAVVIGNAANNGMYFGTNSVLFSNSGNVRFWMGSTGVQVQSTGSYYFGSTADASGSSDATVSRQAAGVVQIGTTAANALGNLVTAGYVTAGSGTGVTVNATGYLRRHVYKVTVTYAALAAAAVDADKTIATLPKKTRLTGIIADTTVPYTGGAVSAATMVCGNGTTGDDCSYLASIDVLSATSTKGLLDADLGTKMTRAAAIQGGCVPSWSLTGPVNIRITTAGANTNALTAGCTEFYLITESLNT